MLRDKEGEIGRTKGHLFGEFGDELYWRGDAPHGFPIKIGPYEWRAINGALSEVIYPLSKPHPTCTMRIWREPDQGWQLELSQHSWRRIWVQCPFDPDGSLAQQLFSLIEPLAYQIRYIEGSYREQQRAAIAALLAHLKASDGCAWDVCTILGVEGARFQVLKEGLVRLGLDEERWRGIPPRFDEHGVPEEVVVAFRKLHTLYRGE